VTLNWARPFSSEKTEDVRLDKEIQYLVVLKVPNFLYVVIFDRLQTISNELQQNVTMFL